MRLKTLLKLAFFLKINENEKNISKISNISWLKAFLKIIIQNCVESP